MTFMTPVGERYDDELPPERRRHALLSHVVVASVALAVLVGIGYVTYLTLLDDSAKPAAATPTACPTAKPVTQHGRQAQHRPQPKQVIVNVYNATHRQGLARSTAGQLHTFGFHIHSVANDPQHRTIKGVAEIRGGPAATRQIALLKTYVKGATVRRDRRHSATVDLVLGQRFSSLYNPVPIVRACA
jgi:hypothetical protein